MKYFLNFIFICELVVGGLTSSLALGEVAPSIIERIDCEGNKKTVCSYIVAQTQLREGSILDDDKVRDAELRLKLLGHFDEADIRLVKGSGVGKVVLVISVQEHSSISFNASAGVVRPWKLFYGIADATLADRNFSGRGDSLSLRLRTNYQDQLAKSAEKYASLVGKTVNEEFLSRLEYIRPAVLLARMYLVAGLGYGKKNSNRYPDTFNGWNDIALGYRLFDYSSIAVGYRFFWRGYHSSPFIQYGWDSQDNPNFPTTGSRLQAAVNFNPGAYYRYYNSKEYSLSLQLSYLKHWQLAEGHILSLRIGDFRGNDAAFEMREDWSLSLRYTNYFKRHSTGDGIQNASFYIEPGFFETAGDLSWEHQAGVRIGTVFQTSFGVFNIFAIGSGF